MLCESCRWSGRPGFVRVLGRGPSTDHVDARTGLIACPECGGTGIAHCCDGICEQPPSARDLSP